MQEIPANFLKPGAAFTVQASGKFQTAGGSQTTSMFLNIAPTVAVSVTGFSAGTVPWQLTANMTCIDKSNMNVSLSLSMLGIPAAQNLGNVAFDTSANQTIDLNVQFAEAGDTEKWSTTSLQEFFIFEQLKTLIM